jgi:glutamine amidotransferase
MCRLLGYLGPPIFLEKLLYKPEHSLVVQSYQPQEMETALLNADGFGIGWYHPQQQMTPFTYRQTFPIWNDINLPQLSRYIESPMIVSYVRSATPGLAVDLSNCQPFSYGPMLFIHNGFIENFRQTLYRQMRDRMGDTAYHALHGLTDSEHLFGLLIDELDQAPDLPLEKALYQVIQTTVQLANQAQIRAVMNIIVSDGQRLVASRFDSAGRHPSLYWLRDDPRIPGGILIASEPLFDAPWTPCPESSILSVGADLDLQHYDLSDLQP